MSGPINDTGLPVHQLTITLTSAELAGVLASGWEHLPIVPGAPLMSVKRRLSDAARERLNESVLRLP